MVWLQAKTQRSREAYRLEFFVKIQIIIIIYYSYTFKINY